MEVSTVAGLGAMIRRDVPPHRVGELARSIAHAFDELWVVEDLPFAGGISQAAAVLEATSGTAVGHGIAPAPFRNPAVLAMEWATLADMHPGRFIGGLGHGFQRWMAQIGARVESPLTVLDETISVVRRLLAGETVTIRGRYVQLDDIRLEFPPQRVPMVLAGVTGPKSLLLAGAVADGTLLSEGHGPNDLARVRDLIARGAREAGRDGPHHLAVFAAFYIGNPDDLASPDAGALPRWAAVDTDATAVADELRSLFTAGADSVVLVPLGDDARGQVQLAAAELAPRIAT